MPPHMPQRRETIIAPTSSGRIAPHNGEGAIIPLRDGRLLLGWTRFGAGGPSLLDLKLYIVPTATWIA